MSDRIAVLNQGRIEQVGAPMEVYERPATSFVAGFIGISNLIERDGRQLTVRPEKIRMLPEGGTAPGGFTFETGRIVDVVYVGVLTRYVIGLDAGGTLVVARQNESAPENPGGLRGTPVRIAWQAGQAFAVTQSANDLDSPREER